MTTTTQYRGVRNGSVLRYLTTSQAVGGGGVARQHKIVGYWLMGCCGMIVGSVVIGGWSGYRWMWVEGGVMCG